LWSKQTNGKKSYCDRHPIDQFLPLAIEVFACWNKQADVFLDDCANAMWNFKRSKDLFSFVLVTFFHQNFSITSQRIQTSSILSRVVAISLIISQFSPFWNTPPSPWLTFYMQLLVEMKRFWHTIYVRV